MGIASLVLGIIGIFISWIPIIGLISFVLVIIGLILGILDVSKKTKTNEKRGIGIAGIIINAVGIPVSIIMFVISLGIITAILIGNDAIIDRTEEIRREINESAYSDEISLNEIYEKYENSLKDYNI